MSQDELNSLASALRALTPTSQPLDRDAVLFQAGQASLRAARQWRWLWPLATAASTLLAVGFGVVLATRPAKVRTVERIVYREVPTPAPEPTPNVEPPPPSNPPAVTAAAVPWSPPSSRYEREVDNVYRFGLDGLPPAPPTRRPPVATDRPNPSF